MRSLFHRNRKKIFFKNLKNGRDQWLQMDRLAFVNNCGQNLVNKILDGQNVFLKHCNTFYTRVREISDSFPPHVTKVKSQIEDLEQRLLKRFVMHQTISHSFVQIKLV